MVIAAPNSIEAYVANVAIIDLFYADQDWAKLHCPGTVERVLDMKNIDIAAIEAARRG